MEGKREGKRGGREKRVEGKRRGVGGGERVMIV